jgi:uncharacterized protein (DUF885 family)
MDRDATHLRATPVFQLADALVDAYADVSPVEATLAGVGGRDGTWGDLGLDGADAKADLLRSTRARLRALGPMRSRWERVAARAVEGFLDEHLEAHEHGEHLVDLNNIESTLQHLRQAFDLADRSTEAGWEATVARLATIDGAIAGYRARLEQGRSRELVVAKRQVLAGIEQARVQAGDRSFFPTLRREWDASRIEDGRLGAALDHGIESARRGFGELADYLEKEYLPAARDEDAVGRERYLRSARRFLGMTIDPVEAYAWGWHEVHAIEAEMARVARSIVPGASVPEVVRVLEADPARSAPSPDAFLAAMRERQERALAELDGAHFDVPEPIRRIDVRMAPPGGALGAYYVPPSEGFDRCGTIWYSPGDAETFPLYDEISTAYHEGFPGHHLQCGIQVFLAEKLTRLHRLFVMYSGYAEGWALYAEQLMHELGYLERPEYVLGMLSAKLMRACRVVVDIGLHLGLRIPEDEEFHPGKTWSWALAAELVHTRAFLRKDHAESEATRYCGWPGQAISYKIGERVILELREEARRRDGARFDLKAFHARVLGAGSVGLEHLREIVREE